MVLLLLTACSGEITPVSSLEATTHPTQTDQPKATETTQTTTPAKSPTHMPTIQPTPDSPLAIAPLPDTTIERYRKLELDLLSNLRFENPYDPEEIDLRVIFTSPSGVESDIGAFWYQDFDLKLRIPLGEPGWKARFTPTETGKWSAAARIPRKGLVSEAVTFEVVESERPGYVRINPSNPRYFAFDDGSFFYPIGMNIAWWSGAGDALFDYSKWMDPLAANGGNAMRTWMAEWSFGIEWNDTPLGNYDNRLKRAWFLDQVLDMAEERDIYVLLVLLNCADFNNWQTNGWNENPYNEANGGPLASPDQFATDPTARALLQRKLNYIVNRWGYSTHLMAWEWWNEVNLAGIPDSLLLPWYQEMTAYLKALDVNKHLVTNSYAISDTHPSWLLPEMEIIQKHEYAHQEETMNKDLAERVTADLAVLVGDAPPKPALMGEFGYGTESWGKDIDKTGIHMHNGMWATTFAGYGGSGMYWFWDVYVEVYQVWYHFKGLSHFLEGINLAQYQPFSPLDIQAGESSSVGAFGMGMRGPDTLVWIRSDAYTVQESEAAQGGKPSAAGYTPSQVDGLELTLHEMGKGTYTVKWFDPQRAKWLEAVTDTAQGGSLTLSIPSFNRDLAARIIRNP